MLPPPSHRTQSPNPPYYQYNYNLQKKIEHKALKSNMTKLHIIVYFNVQSDHNLIKRLILLQAQIDQQIKNRFLSNYFIMTSFTSKYNSTPTFSFKSKFQTVTSTNQKETIPSPTQYQTGYLNISLSKVANGKFNRQQKGLRLKINKETPGPATYDSSLSITQSSFNKKQTLKHGQVRFKEVNQESPSPNQYLINDYNKKSLPRFSIGNQNKSLSIQQSQQVPAPNVYNPNLIAPRSQSYSIGTSQRKINMLPGKNPGPAAYQVAKKFVSSISFNQKNVFSRQKKQISFHHRNNSPGPGLYFERSFIAQNLKNNRGFTLRQKHFKPQISTPGPGQYENQELSFKFKSIGTALPTKSERTLFNTEYKKGKQLPGPGSHQTTITQELKFRSTSVSKFSKAKLPHFSPTTKQKKLDFLDPVGVNINHRSLPHFSISRSKRSDFTLQKQKIGLPDKFYDWKINTVSSKRAQTSFAIPKAERLKQEKDSLIGPGAYNPENQSSLAKHSKFHKSIRKTFLDDLIKSKLTTFKHYTYENREQFPNPPKYANVYKKLQFNQKTLTKI